MENESLGYVAQFVAGGAVGVGVRLLMGERSPGILKVAVAGAEVAVASALVAFNPALAPVFWGVLLGNGASMALSRK